MIHTFARKFFKRRRLLPFLLFKTFTTCCTLRSASIVLTSTDKFIWHCRILDIAGIRMTITHTSTPDTDVFDGIKILKCT